MRWQLVLLFQLIMSMVLGAQDPSDARGCFDCGSDVEVILDEDLRGVLTLEAVVGSDVVGCPSGLVDALELIVYDGYYEDNGGVANEVLQGCGVFDYVVRLKAGYEEAYIWESCGGRVHALGGSELSCEVVDTEVLNCTEVDFDPSDAESVSARFGRAEDVLVVGGGCDVSVSESVVYTPGACGSGLIDRIFEVSDDLGRRASCTQRISIDRVNAYELRFPGDESNVACGEMSLTDVSYSSSGCDIFAVSRDTVRFDVSGGICFELLIKYSVINWCEYEGGSLEPTQLRRDIDGDNRYEEATWLEAGDRSVSYLTQAFPLCGASWSEEDVDADGSVYVVGLYGQDNATGVRESYPRRLLIGSDCSSGGYHAGVGEYVYDASVGCYRELGRGGASGDPCGEMSDQWWTPGFYEYTQRVRVNDNDPPEIELDAGSMTFCSEGTPSEGCDGSVELRFRIKDACTPGGVDLRGVEVDLYDDGDAVALSDYLGYGAMAEGSGVYRISGMFPIGNHTFVLSGADGCGNVVVRRVSFEVSDCRSPVPMCVPALSVDLLPSDSGGGSSRLMAEAFLSGDIEDCSAFAGELRQVRYYAFKAEDLAGGVEGLRLSDLTEASRSVLFTCSDEGAVPVHVVALDAAGNWGYCTVLVVVQPGVWPSPCGEEEPGTGSIGGVIADESERQMSGVEVSLSGESDLTYRTDETGTYSFTGLIEGYDYTVTPGLDEHHLNGVSTFDLVLISKHILGVKPLDSPYKLIAADVNNSRAITALDLIQLRKLILNVDTKFSNNTSWRFVKGGYVFPDPSNPWRSAFPELDNINNMPSSDLELDFVGVKIGDVNGSASAGGGLLDVEPRGDRGRFGLAVADADLSAGEVYRAEFRSPSLRSVDGYQFTLAFSDASLELLDVEYGLAKAEHFGLFAAEGAITTSWDAVSGGSGRSVEDGELLFALVFRARRPLRLSEALGISSRLTPAEAYGVSGELLDVVLDFGAGRLEPAGFELYQNRPNPFGEQTLLSFSLPQAGRVRIRISDVNGRLLKVIEGDFNQGYNELRLDRGDLPAGVLSYTLESRDCSATRKMISVK